MDSTLYHEYMVVEGDQTVYLDAPEAGAVENPNYDHIIAGKKPYFTPWFFWLRTLGYVGDFLDFRSIVPKSGRCSRMRSRIWICTTSNFAAVRYSWWFLLSFSSMFAWDWVMSIDVHWFSTLFGWYFVLGHVGELS